jgi:hypothetical protein
MAALVRIFASFLFRNDEFMLVWLNRQTGDLISLLSKRECGLIQSPVCLSACPPPITFEPLGRFS